MEARFITLEKEQIWKGKFKINCGIRITGIKQYISHLYTRTYTYRSTETGIYVHTYIYFLPLLKGPGSNDTPEAMGTPSVLDYGF